ncbi:hypothetical protein L484_022762 [Morus notabilis]|uniref:Uncharacterized protein n=1 Tax=Morus notabilis TaxID=981085 RepID=W9SK98_9ROSA|nr:hypothetical protein L484_022762 [Morus notabilis]
MTSAISGSDFQILASSRRMSAQKYRGCLLSFLLDRDDRHNNDDDDLHHVDGGLPSTPENFSFCFGNEVDITDRLHYL